MDDIASGASSVLLTLMLRPGEPAFFSASVLGGRHDGLHVSLWLDDGQADRIVGVMEAVVTEEETRSGKGRSKG